VTEKRCNKGEERQQLELDVGAWESKRELEREGRRCSLLRGEVLAFYRSWGVPGRQWPSSNGQSYGVNHH
jgi:hypothetical protein